MEVFKNAKGGNTYRLTREELQEVIDKACAIAVGEIMGKERAAKAAAASERARLAKSARDRAALAGLAGQVKDLRKAVGMLDRRNRVEGAIVDPALVQQILEQQGGGRL